MFTPVYSHYFRVQLINPESFIADGKRGTVDRLVSELIAFCSIGNIEIMHCIFVLLKFLSLWVVGMFVNLELFFMITLSSQQTPNWVLWKG
jgi:hypothetical protein